MSLDGWSWNDATLAFAINHMLAVVLTSAALGILLVLILREARK